ncbi:MAG: hypothetical protein B6I19_02685 [Bacteroidetes bacterium 4572_114]|nr:MAG: hypothetical protein B6I19_02685 [Bacteroidetes bacterium 4572_114]
MKIANPLYDKTFKYLMENNRIAKKVISVLLDREVIELTVGQQETVVPYEQRGFTLFRLDFKAIIKEPDGSKKKVLLELQKSKYPTDIQRFRNYPGTNYMHIDAPKGSKKDEKKRIKTKEKIEDKEIFPIITIYILGYDLDDLPFMAVTVNNEVINSVNKEKVQVKSFFIDHLTHSSHIIQVRRLPGERRTRLEKFLTLFNQAWISEKKYILDLQDVPEEFKDIAKYLHGPIMDSTFRKQLEAEEEIDTIFDEQEAKFLHKLEESKLRETEAKQRETEAKQREGEAKQREKALAKKLARQMLKFKLPIREIIEETGLAEEEISAL